MRSKYEYLTPHAGLPMRSPLRLEQKMTLYGVEARLFYDAARNEYVAKFYTDEQYWGGDTDYWTDSKSDLVRTATLRLRAHPQYVLRHASRLMRCAY